MLASADVCPLMPPGRRVVFTRRDFTMVLVIIVLWDVGKGAIRIWERKTWANTRPGSLSHDAADLTSVFVG